MNDQLFSKQYMSELTCVLENLNLKDWSKILQELERVFYEDATIFLIGNGGSASTASHLANDLMLGAAREGGRGFKAISLCDNAAVTMAIANDTSYDQIFSQQLRVLARPGDVLLSISGSGNSHNLVEAVRTANELDMTTIGFLGMDGGKLLKMCGTSIVVPSDDYGLIETVHVALDHLLVDYFKQLQKNHANIDRVRGTALAVVRHAWIAETA
jgi:D-sedoheptulose 7-phosphate isomerase